VAVLRTKKHYRQGHFGGFVATSTASQLVQVNSRRGGEPRFDNILPSAMKKMVEDGLFEPWEGSYRITPKGKAMLKKLESE
jgi:hypothetical protein